MATFYLMNKTELKYLKMEKIFTYILRGEMENLKEILRSGEIDINQKNEFGDTPLTQACEEGNKEMVELILSIKHLDINLAGMDEYTPLHCAVQKSFVQIVDLLLEHGAKVDVVDNDGNTPLVEAVMSNKDLRNADIIKSLLKYGADPNTPNKHGITLYKLGFGEKVKQGQNGF
jgi:uncharacterized protein